MLNTAPIALFVYNRPSHTRRTLENLINVNLSDQSQLYIFSDGPPSNSSTELINRIAEVRKVIREKKWCGEVTIIESESNKGLATSIIDGVTQIVDQHGKIIVLEDDLLFSKCFLEFMNDALVLYESSTNVYSINGFMFPVNESLLKVVLLPLFFTWGWGTWKDKWKAFKIEPENITILLSNKFLRSRFNLGDYDYSYMLETSKNSWGIHWYFSIFQRNGLSLFPTKSLVLNMGLDGSGVNCGIRDDIDLKLIDAKVPICLTDKIDIDFYSKLLKYFQATNTIQNENSTNFCFLRIKKFLYNLFCG